MNFIVIKKSNPEDWYYELDGRIVPVEKEDERFYFIRVRNEVLPVLKSDAKVLEEIELDLPEDVIENMEKYAKQLGITVDELVNQLLSLCIKSNGEEDGSD